MLTTELRESLLQECHPEQQDKALPRRYLMALVEMGRFNNERRQEITQRLRKYCLPLLQHPNYTGLAPYGAMLLAHPEYPESSESLLEQLAACGYDSDDTCLVWITATQTPSQMAAHLSRFTFAEDERQKRYLLRYYAPRITPILHRFAPDAWVADFLGPVVSWWYAVATPQHETWQRLAGGGRVVLARQPATLRLNDELRDALVNDPLPYHILHVMEQQLPEVLSDASCYGVRLARVEKALGEARQQGLRQEADLIAYTLATLQTPTLPTDASWQNAVRSAAQGKTPLSAWQPRN